MTEQKKPKSWTFFKKDKKEPAPVNRVASSEKLSWTRRWFGGVGRKEYFFALPFCIGMLSIPILPMAGLYYVLRQGQAPLVGLGFLLLTFGYPFLRVKRPRLAWWVGTLVACGSFFGLAVLNVIVGRFFGFYVFLTWVLALAFLIFNWKRLRWWTFAVFAIIVLIHMVPMGFSRTVSTLLGMGLLALYFRLPDRDNFPRAPIFVSLIMALLAAHGMNFYFDVGGHAAVLDHPAAHKIFEYTGQRGKWARALGANPRFLTPSCDGTKFYVGTKFSWKSGLTVIDPATGKFQKLPMPGGTTDNLMQDCDRNLVYFGNMGANKLFAYNPGDMAKPVAAEKVDGVRAGLLRLDRQRDRLYMASSNTNRLYLHRALNLALLGSIDLPTSVTDMTIDLLRDHDVIVATMGGEILRLSSRDGQVLKRSQMKNIGLLIYNLELDQIKRRLYVSSMFSHQLTVLDADTLEPVAAIPVQHGSRYMRFDQRRGLLYLANFYNGVITAYDGANLKIRWSMEVGRRVRYLTLDHPRDQLCFASQVGGFCLALERLSPAPPVLPALAETKKEAATEPSPNAEQEETPSAEQP